MCPRRAETSCTAANLSCQQICPLSSTCRKVKYIIIIIIIINSYTRYKQKVKEIIIIIIIIIINAAYKLSGNVKNTLRQIVSTKTSQKQIINDAST